MSAQATKKISARFADEEVASSSTYGAGYTGLKNPQDQHALLHGYFPKLGAPDFAIAERELPDGAEGYLEVPLWESIASSPDEALKMIFDLLYANHPRKFYYDPAHYNYKISFRHSTRFVEMMARITEEQKGHGSILLPVQAGIRHAGRSIRRARELMELEGNDEFGLDAYIGSVLMLTHPKRIQKESDLQMDLPGDEADDRQFGGERFSAAPYYYITDKDKLLGFASGPSNFPLGSNGSASAWAPHQ